jgi:hypothetical protein
MTPTERLRIASEQLRAAVEEITAARAEVEGKLGAALAMALSDADGARRRVESVRAWLRGMERDSA